MFVDVHAHLDSKGFIKPIKAIVEEAAEAGLVAIINCGLNRKSNRATERLAKQFHIVKPAYGFYPTDAEKTSQKEIDEELKWIKRRKPIAISEVGLEGKWGKDFKKQEQVFSKFDMLATGLDIPLIVHTREKEKQCIDILEKLKAKKVVLHCFTGPEPLVVRAMKLGYSFSIPPIILYNQRFQSTVKLLAMDRILTETDSPYLAPKRGTINSPKNVRLTVAKIAEIKGLNPEETKRIIFLNYQRLFA